MESDNCNTKTIDFKQCETAGLNSDQLKYLRLLWCDGAGIRRCRMVTLPFSPQECSDVLNSLSVEGVGVSSAAMALPAWGDVPAPNSGMSISGILRVAPILQTIKRLPWRPNTAIAMCQMLDPRTSLPSNICPRATLQRALDALNRKVPGATVCAGFETEFIMLRRQPDGTLQPLDYQAYCSSRSAEEQADLMEEIVVSIEKIGLKVEQFHKESAPGQFELVVRFAEVLQACDDVLMTRETIVGVCAKHGVIATFLPKYFSDAAGNATHVHLSLWVNGENLLERTTISEDLEVKLDPVVEAFCAGILEHLPSLLCFTAPTPNSFRRLVPHCWAGAYKCWGIENKEAPIRFILPPTKDKPVTNFEFKALDATACPYYAAAALIAAGLDGICKQMMLPPPCQVDPSTLEEGTQASYPRLPKSVLESLELLRSEAGGPIRQIIGSELCQTLCSIRESEAQYLSSFDFDFEVKTLFDKY